MSKIASTFSRKFHFHWSDILNLTTDRPGAFCSQIQPVEHPNRRAGRSQAGCWTGSFSREGCLCIPILRAICSPSGTENPVNRDNRTNPVPACSERGWIYPLYWIECMSTVLFETIQITDELGADSVEVCITRRGNETGHPRIPHLIHKTSYFSRGSMAGPHDPPQDHAAGQYGRL